MSRYSCITVDVFDRFPRFDGQDGVGKLFKVSSVATELNIMFLLFSMQSKRRCTTIFNYCFDCFTARELYNVGLGSSRC